jgi:hypothetical protein
MVLLLFQTGIEPRQRGADRLPELHRHDFASADSIEKDRRAVVMTPRVFQRGQPGQPFL